MTAETFHPNLVDRYSSRKYLLVPYKKTIIIPFFISYMKK